MMQLVHFLRGINAVRGRLALHIRSCRSMSASRSVSVIGRVPVRPELWTRTVLVVLVGRHDMQNMMGPRSKVGILVFSGTLNPSVPQFTEKI